ncbi:MAG TPA: urease accessory protein UreE [Burkholderiaceae bacterium]|nr:urease accessory protein UreE [Burkholderiaceae bacterium]
MIRLTAVARAPLTPEQAARTPRLPLAYHERVRSRLAAMLPDGQGVAITLPRGSVMRGGTVLTGDDGACVIVDALAEPVAKVTAPSPLALMRATYHLANRHVPAQLASDHVLIERDPVLEHMLEGLGATVQHIEAPFDPEAGAYDGQNAHGHVHASEVDEVSATVGEQLSIAAHRARSGAS